MPENERKHVVLDATGKDDDGVWWVKPDDEIGAAMVSVAENFFTAMEPRREVSRRYVQLHKGQAIGSVYESAMPRALADDMLAWNVIQAATNTGASVVVTNRVRVTFQTIGADYELQEMAKLADLFVAGAWRGNKVYEKLDPLWWLDAAVPGLGALLVEPDSAGNVVIRRIIPDEMAYNEAEGIHGDPQQFFIVQWMSKYAAIAEYATTVDKDGITKVDAVKRDAINSVTAYQFPLPGLHDRHIPIIPIYKGWVLPSKPGMKDGKRVVGIAGNKGPGCTLSSRPYKWNRLPIAFLRTEPAPAGLWGIGFAERLAGFQYRLNELNYDIEQASRLGSVGKWMVSTSANVNLAHLNNEHEGVVLHASGEVPQHVTIDAIPRDLLNERNTTYEQALKSLGLSEWTTSGVQPANIESGEGLRQLRDQEQGRALPAGQTWEGSHVDLGELTVMAAIDGAEINKDMFVVVPDPGGDGLVRVDFKEIAKLINDTDSWIIAPYPTSILPNSPTAKFEKLREWKADGTITPAEFAELSEMPDTQGEASLLLAGIRAVRWALGQIVKKGVKGYEPPDPAMPLEQGIKIAHSHYLRGLRNGMPEEKLALLLSWIDDCRTLLSGKPSTASMAGPPGAEGNPPPSEPTAPAPIDGVPVDPGPAIGEAPPPQDVGSEMPAPSTDVDPTALAPAV